MSQQRTEKFEKYPDRKQLGYIKKFNKQQLKTNPQLGEIKKGIRGPEFLTFIKNILVVEGKLTEEFANKIISDEESMKLFDRAFTHKSANEIYNYELLELYGDKVVDYCILKFTSERFPKLRDGGLNPPAAVRITSKLHLYLRSKAFLALAGNKIGFYPYISINTHILKNQNENLKMYEDIFEAFMCVVDRVVNKFTKEEVGFIICYEILRSTFDKMDISLKYEFVYDSITILKEYAQKFKATPTYTYARNAMKTFKLRVSYHTSEGIYTSDFGSTMNDDQNKAHCELYKQFFMITSNLAKEGKSLNITNIEIVSDDDQSFKGLTGTYGQITTRCTLDIYDIEKHAYITLATTGSGYDKSSAEKEASTKIIQQIMDMYNKYKDTYGDKADMYNVYVMCNAWDDSIWI